MPKGPKVYVTLEKRYTTQALKVLRFVPDGSQMVKRGMCRKPIAVASSLDGVWWRVTPLDRGWRY